MKPPLIRKMDLNPAIRRHIQFLEATTQRRCVRLWEQFYDERDEKYLFGSFYNGLDRSIYTVAFWNAALERWI